MNSRTPEMNIMAASNRSGRGNPCRGHTSIRASSMARRCCTRPGPVWHRGIRSIILLLRRCTTADGEKDLVLVAMDPTRRPSPHHPPCSRDWCCRGRTTQEGNGQMSQRQILPVVTKQGLTRGRDGHNDVRQEMLPRRQLGVGTAVTHAHAQLLVMR